MNPIISQRGRPAHRVLHPPPHDPRRPSSRVPILHHASRRADIASVGPHPNQTTCLANFEARGAALLVQEERLIDDLMKAADCEPVMLFPTPRHLTALCETRDQISFLVWTKSGHYPRQTHDPSLPMGHPWSLGILQTTLSICEERWGSLTYGNRLPGMRHHERNLWPKIKPTYPR